MWGCVEVPVRARLLLQARFSQTASVSTRCVVVQTAPLKVCARQQACAQPAVDLTVGHSVRKAACACLMLALQGGLAEPD